MASDKNLVWEMLKDLSQKQGITEIVINAPEIVFVERHGEFIQLKANLTNNDVDEFISEVSLFNRKECNEENPILDGILPDGSRINIILPPYTGKFPAITIRKFIRQYRSFDTVPDLFGIDNRWISFFKALVRARMNLIISGGTGVGKTTFLNILLNEVNRNDRVITIEDTSEIQLTIPNHIALEIRRNDLRDKKSITVRDLVKNTLRMRPDRIIIGEIRGGEFFDLLQAMNTGHDGSMTSVHANSPSETVSRMENLFLMSGFDMPYHVVRKQIATGVDFILHLERDRFGRRYVSYLTELTGMEGHNILSQNIAINSDGQKLKFTGITPKSMQKLSEYGGIPIDFFSTFDKPK